MAGEHGSPWPLPRFCFSVDFGDGTAARFQEVSGLAVEATPIQYRHGNSPLFSTMKMPGLAQVGNVTMRKGIFPSDGKFWAWYDEIKMNTVQRRTVVVRLLDESGAPTMSWTLHKACPTKITGTDSKSAGAEVAVEAIEIAFERMDVSAGD